MAGTHYKAAEQYIQYDYVASIRSGNDSNPDINPLHRLIQPLTENQRYHLMQTCYEGSTILHVAAHSGHKETVELVLDLLTQQQRFQLLKMQNGKGRTAIHCAVAIFIDQPQTVRSLLKSVSASRQIALLTIKDRFNQTARETAEHFNNILAEGVIQQYYATARNEAQLNSRQGRISEFSSEIGLG